MSVDIDGSATSVRAQLVVNRSTLNVGSVEVGSAGEGTVIPTNVGNATSGAVIVVPSAGVTTSGCTDILPAGASCPLTIAVTPTAPGAFSGTVSITANPGATTPLVVAVISTYAGFIYQVTPSAFDFGDIIIGVPVAKQTITVTAGMDISDLTVSSSGADISIDQAASTCTSTLAAHKSCVVVFDFLATTPGVKSGGITISAGGLARKLFIVPVSARVLALVVSPSTPQDFVAGGTITFGVTNAGDTPTVVTVAVTGPSAPDFSITDNTCLVLAPLAVCTVSVVFNPLSVDAGGARMAKLVVTDQGTEDLSVVDLVGDGRAASVVPSP